MTIQSISQGNYSPYPSPPKSTFNRNVSELASGFRLNQASSGASELAIYEKLTAQMQGLRQGISNAASMNDLVNTAQGGLGAINDNLQRIRELSLQASNGILTEDDRAIIQGEVGHLLSGINDLASNTAFNGMKLLNGTFTNRHTAISPNGSGMKVSIGNMSLGGLSMTGFNVMNNPNIATIDRAIGTVSGARSSLGAVSNAFGHAINSNAVAEMQLASARSRFADTNVAHATSQFSRNKTINQYQILMRRNDMAMAKNALQYMA